MADCLKIYKDYIKFQREFEYVCVPMSQDEKKYHKCLSNYIRKVHSNNHDYWKCIDPMTNIQYKDHIK
jgi:hypothetical protein